MELVASVVASAVGTLPADAGPGGMVRQPGCVLQGIDIRLAQGGRELPRQGCYRQVAGVTGVHCRTHTTCAGRIECGSQVDISHHHLLRGRRPGRFPLFFLAGRLTLATP